MQIKCLKLKLDTTSNYDQLQSNGKQNKSYIHGHFIQEKKMKCYLRDKHNKRIAYKSHECRHRLNNSGYVTNET